MIPLPPFGKRLPSATYTARASIERLGAPWKDRLIAACRRAAVSHEEIQVIKLHHDSARLSLLAYPGFLDEPHPALAQAITVDQVSGEVRRTEFLPDSDPPILHRCEQLLEPDHPAAPRLHQCR